MIKVKKTDYILGVWMVSRVKLGKAYVYCIQGKNEREWTIYTKTYYDNESYNMFINDNAYKNTHPYSDKSELEIIKLCNQHADDLNQLFDNFYYKTLIGGNHEIYLEVSKKEKWLPPLYIEDETKLKDNPIKKKKKRNT